MVVHSKACKNKRKINSALQKILSFEIVVFKLSWYVPGDPGDNALGRYEGEIRGPNDLASGGFDGLGAGLGNVVAAEHRGIRVYTREN